MPISRNCSGGNDDCADDAGRRRDGLPGGSGWDKPIRHVAARAAEMKFALAPNTATRLRLIRADRVKLATPSRATRGTSAGLAALDVPRAGTLDVVLSNASYVDLVRDGKPLRSTAHRMTTGCKGMRKAVSFAVVPGRYVVQLTGAPQASVVMGTVLR